MNAMTNGQDSYSTSETGHAKNLANFNQMIIYCEGISAYNPPNVKISISGLKALYDDVKASFEGVDEAMTRYSNIIDDRQLVYEELPKLTTRILGALSASGVNNKRIDEFKTINNKIQGRPPKIKTNDDEDMQEVGATRSNSQMSFDSTANFFRQLVEILEQTPEYAPNEVELNMISLANLSEELYELNELVLKRKVDYINALKLRNQLMYLNDDCLFLRSKQIKSYVKSLLGTDDAMYKKINGIRFSDLAPR